MYFQQILGIGLDHSLANRGQHWLRITERNEARLAPLNEIEDRVRLDWIAQEEDLRLQQQVDELWNKYSIRILNDSQSE